MGFAGLLLLTSAAGLVHGVEEEGLTFGDRPAKGAWVNPVKDDPVTAPSSGGQVAYYYQLKGGPERVYPDTVAPHLTCPDGYDQQGRACVRIMSSQVSSFCPDQYNLDAITDECLTHKRKVARLSCPTGSIHKNNRCEVLDIVQATMGCDAGWTLEDDLCMKLGATQSKNICPEGFRLTKNGCTAQSRINADWKCPPSFELVGKRCESWVYEKPIKECLPGFVLLDGNCIKETKQQPTFQCPMGGSKSIHTDDACYHETVLKPLHKCGQGSESGKTKNLCEFVLTQEVKWTCPAGFEMSPHLAKTCTRTVEEPMIPSCSPGFKLDDNGVCTRTYTQKADVACPEGTLSRNGNCIVVSTTPSEASCPRGFTLNNGFCLQITSRPPTERCPRGYKPTGYHDECEMIVAVNPELSCPDGFVSKTGGVCENLDIANSISICEDGSIPGIDGQCRKLESKPPRFDCPNGFTLKQQECTKMASTPGVYYCDEGQVIGNECDMTIKMPALSECPKGFIGTDGICQRTEVLEAKLECPRKYRLKNGLCVKV